MGEAGAVVTESGDAAPQVIESKETPSRGDELGCAGRRGAQAHIGGIEVQVVAAVAEYFDPARLGVGDGEGGPEGQLDQASGGASGRGGLGGVVRPRGDATFGVVTWAGALPVTRAVPPTGSGGGCAVRCWSGIHPGYPP